MFSRCVIATMFLIAGAFATAEAGSNRIPGEAARDVRHTLQARKLLSDDPDLESINIGVDVTDRVAVLWGPVPSAEVARRAVAILKSMVELVEIRNELFVSELLEPTRKPLKVDIPPLILPDKAPPALPKLPRDVRPNFGAPGLLAGQEKADAKKALTPTSNSNKEPIAIKVLRLEPLTLGVPQIDEAERDFAEAMRAFLKSNSAYRNVQFTVKDRHVFLSAAEQDSDALHEAARGIARLPNVAGVVLLDKMPPR